MSETLEHNVNHGDVKDRHIKSYVVRAGRMTTAQTQALEKLGPIY